jgi:predicted RNA-binding protein with PUA domain
MIFEENNKKQVVNKKIVSALTEKEKDFVIIIDQNNNICQLINPVFDKTGSNKLTFSRKKFIIKLPEGTKNVK